MESIERLFAPTASRKPKLKVEKEARISQNQRQSAAIRAAKADESEATFMATVKAKVTVKRSAAQRSRQQ